MAQSRKKTAAALRSPRTAASKKAAAARHRNTSLPVVLEQSRIEMKTVLCAGRGDSVPVLEQDEGNDADIHMAVHMEASFDGEVDATVVVNENTEHVAETVYAPGADAGVLEDVTMSDWPLSAVQQTQVPLRSTKSVGVQEATTEDIEMPDAPVAGIDIGDKTFRAIAMYHISGSKADEVQKLGDSLAVTGNSVPIFNHKQSIQTTGKAIPCLELKDKSASEIDVDSTTGSLGIEDSLAITNAEPTSTAQRKVDADHKPGVSTTDVSNNISELRTLTDVKDPTTSQAVVNTKPAKLALNHLEAVDIIKSSFPVAPPPTTRGTRSAVAALAASTSDPTKKSLVVKFKFKSRLDVMQTALAGAPDESSQVDVGKEQPDSEDTLKRTDGHNVEKVSSIISDNASRTATMGSKAAPTPSREKATAKPRLTCSKKVKAITKSTLAAAETTHGAQAGMSSPANESAPLVEFVKTETADTGPALPAAPKQRVGKTNVDIAAAKSAAETKHGPELPVSVGEAINYPLVKNLEAESAASAGPKKRVRRTKAQIASDKAAAEAARAIPLAENADGEELPKPTAEVVKQPAATYTPCLQRPNDLAVTNAALRPSRARKPSLKARKMLLSMKPVAENDSKVQGTPGLTKKLRLSPCIVGEASNVEISTIAGATGNQPARKRKRESKAEQTTTKLANDRNIKSSSGKVSEAVTIPEVAPAIPKPSKRRARRTSTQPLVAHPHGEPITQAYVADIAMADMVAHLELFTAPALGKPNARATNNTLRKKPPVKRTRKDPATATTPLGTVIYPRPTEQAISVNAPLKLIKPSTRVKEDGVCTRDQSTGPNSVGLPTSFKQPANRSSEVSDISADKANQRLLEASKEDAVPELAAVTSFIPASQLGPSDVQAKRKTSKTGAVTVGQGVIITFKGYPRPWLPLHTAPGSAATKAVATKVVEELPVASADTYSGRKTVVQRNSPLLPTVVDSNNQTNPQAIQDAPEGIRLVVPRMRSETPALPNTSRITRSRGPAAPVPDIPKELVTSDWMGDVMQGLKSGGKAMLSAQVDTVVTRPTNTTNHADGTHGAGLFDRKPSGQIQPLVGGPRPAGKRRRGLAASPAMGNVDAAAQVITGNVGTQPINQHVAKRARTRTDAAPTGPALDTIRKTMEPHPAATEEHSAHSTAPPSTGNSRRSGSMRLAPMRLDPSLGTRAPVAPRATPIPKARLVVIKGRNYTPDALEQISIANAPHLAIDVDTPIPAALVVTKNGKRRAPTLLEGVAKKLRVQPAWRGDGLSGLPTRRIRLPKEALVFHTSLTWDALNNLLQDAGQFCCDPSQLMLDELDLAAHYKEEQGYEKRMQKVWYRKEYSDPEKRRMPCVGFYPKPVMGKTERLTATEMRADMKTFKDGKAEMEARESELLDRYTRILLEPFTAI